MHKNRNTNATLIAYNLLRMLCQFLKHIQTPQHAKTGTQKKKLGSQKKNIKEMLKRNREISKKVTESGHVELAATSPSSGAPKAPWNTVESKRVEYNTQLHTTNQSRHQDIKTIQDYSKLFSNSLQPIKNANLKEPSSPTSHSWKLFFIRQIIIFSSFLPFTKMVKTR